jgi:hypothetical protein
MNIRTSLLALVAIGIAPSAANAAAVVPTLDVVPWLAPNAYGSPSWPGAVSNAVHAMHDGVLNYGDPNQPTYFHAQSLVTGPEAIVTGFNSWKGKADPGSVFGPQYANELGNRMTFALRVDGNGGKVSIDQLSFSAASTDAASGLAFGFAAGSYTYSNDWQGVLKGTDNMLWTSDDVFITSGAASQLVDGIVGRGSGNSFAAYCVGCTTAQQQAAIDDAGSYMWNTFTGTYNYGLASGSATFVQTGVPEPATWAMMLGGFGLLGGAVRRRRTSFQAVTA